MSKKTKSQSKIEWNLDNSYLSLDKKFYSKNNPNEVSNPQLVIVNRDLAKSLNLNLKNIDEEKLAQIFSGNILIENSQPISQAYAGHQFGHFTILGDGRAHLLGEQITKKNERFDIQLKGSGQTSYSRNGDGRAALAPMLREYIISEAMFALKVPTTRSLAVISTGEVVYRQDILPGAILTRVASSHIRVGTFQYARILNDKKLLKQLADYTIKRHYPKIIHDENPYLSLLKSVIEKQIKLICNWMRVGFIHGVMNTDNVSISGETIDYGPCAFMNNYNPATVFSSIDSRGRYAFGNQPGIIKWNMVRFAESLLPLIDEDENKALELAQKIIGGFDNFFHKEWLKMMSKKLGLIGKEKSDEELINSLLKVMEEKQLDYTNTFALLISKLEKLKIEGDKIEGKILPQKWINEWQLRLKLNKKPFKTELKIMKLNNPIIIPRNHLVEEALQNAQNGHLQTMIKLLAALKKPYDSNVDNLYKTPDENQFYQTFCGT